MKRFLIGSCLGVLGCLCSQPSLALEPPSADSAVQQVPSANIQPTILKLNRNLPPNALQGKADTDLVELSSGKRMKVGDIRRLTSIAHKNRSLAPNSLEPRALKLRPAATGGIVLRSKNDLQAVMQRPDSETVVLPSGKRTTVGMLRLFQPQIEERRQQIIRHPQQARPDLSGPAVRVTAGTDWYALLKQPDSTVLETSRGKRITLGELKQTFATSGKQPFAAPQIR